MEFKLNDILLFILILAIPVYLFNSKNDSKNNSSNSLINKVKTFLGINVVYPENKLKNTDINDSAISSTNYKYINNNPVVNIVRNNGDVTSENKTYYKPQFIPKDTMAENDIGTTEYRFAQFSEDTPSKAWVDYNISQTSDYYKSDFSSNIYDLKNFFDKDNIYREIPDNTLYYDSIQPSCPSCYTDVNNTNVCNFNGKLEKIPISLYNVGPNGNTSIQKISSSEIDTINDEKYLVYNYENDKAMNGSNFFNNVHGTSTINNLNSSYIKDDIIKCL